MSLTGRMDPFQAQPVGTVTFLWSPLALLGAVGARREMDLEVDGLHAETISAEWWKRTEVWIEWGGGEEAQGFGPLRWRVRTMYSRSLGTNLT